MCGRYTLISPLDTLWKHFGFKNRPNIVPRWNVAPTDKMPILLQSKQGRVLMMMRGGLIPGSAPRITVGAKSINIRSENIVTNQIHAAAFRSRRCLIPVDSFYEWQKNKDHVQPYLISSADKKPMALAGIWGEWVRPFDVHTGSSRDLGPKGEVIQSYAILTTRASKKIGHIHDRMPVIIDRQAFGLWLANSTTGSTNVRQILDLINLSSQELTFHPVGNQVNNVRNDDATCMKRVKFMNHLMTNQRDLFE